MPWVRNKRTGETVFVPDEQSAPSRGTPIGLQDPARDLERPQAMAGLGKTQADIAGTNASTTRTHVQTQGDVLDNRNKTRSLTQNPISDRDQALINGMRQQQGDLPGVLRDITAAQDAVDHFGTSPWRGALYSMGVPEDDDWAITQAAKNAFGSTFLPKREREDYERLVTLQNRGVLNSQVEQKGPQTESDAARMKLSGVSPSKNVRSNALLLAEQQYDVMMKQEKPGFYEVWANRLGSTHALNGQGKTADQVWNEQYQRGLRKMRADPRYKRAGRPNRRFSRPRVVDFNDWSD